jgi:hypothetical protein
MGFKEELEKKIERKRAEISELESSLKTARTYLQALEDMQRMAARDGGSPTRQTPIQPSPRQSGSMFRTGSMTQAAYDAIKAAGKPLHVSELLPAIGRAVTRGETSAVSGTLAAYIREGKVFTRTAPNTFGLTEFEAGEPAGAKAAQEPPPGFGKL